METPTNKTPQEIEAEELARKKGDEPLPENAPAVTFLKNLISERPKKVEPKPKTEEELEAEETAKAARIAAAKKKAERKVEAASPPPSVIDEEKLGASIGRSIAEATAKAKPEAQAPKETAKDKAEVRRIAVLERMEKMNPDQYKGLSDRFKENKSKLQKYAAEWEAANTGEKFDENADEHSDFIDGLESQVEYEDDDYTEALADIRLDAKTNERKSELDERISNVERTQRAREESPKILKAGVEAGNQFWQEMGDDFKEVITDSGDVNPEQLKAIAEEDPVKHDIAVAAADAVERTAATIYMLAHQLANFDPKNSAHAGLAQFALTQEEELLKRSATERFNDEGLAFARKAEYDRMPKEQRAKHWTFTAEDLTFLATRAIAKQAKADLAAEDAKFTKRAKARGLISNDEPPTPGTGQRKNARSDDEDEEGNGSGASRHIKPQSPTISSSPKLAAGNSANRNSGKNAADRFLAKLIG